MKKTVSIVTLVSFLLTGQMGVCPAIAQEFSVAQLPAPGTMVGETAPFVPAALKGLIVDQQKPLEFQFIVDTGSKESVIASEAKQSLQEQLKQQTTLLIKYFLAGLTIPDGDLWVNLSPYEKDRMVPQTLGWTDLGRDLLAQDYILKQLSASLIYPERDLGKAFWSRIYAKAQEQYGTTNIPVNTFNKVWILPDQAQVFQKNNAVYITQSTLKVMLDADYLAGCQAVNPLNRKAPQGNNLKPTEVYRQLILPEITKEVNSGKNFAPLRQIYQALILAKWYKEHIQNDILDRLYTDKNKVAGVELNDPASKEQIYARYLQAYKKGVFNYIKDEASMPRKYFSGGTYFGGYTIAIDGAMTAVHADGTLESVIVDLAKSNDHAMSSLANSIADLVAQLNNTYQIKPRVQGTDLLMFSHDPKEMVSFIQQYSILKKPEDIRRVLNWRLQSLQGYPLSGINVKTAQLLYNAVFDQAKLLDTLATKEKPLRVVLFRKGSSKQLTTILKTLPNVDVKVILSGTDDGLSWFEGAREFNATGISGAGTALMDLARDTAVSRFLSTRIAGLGKDDLSLERDFRGLIMKLQDKTVNINLSDEMKNVYNTAMRMHVDKRQKTIAYLKTFMEIWDQKRKEDPQTQFQFNLHDVPIRSLALVGAAGQNNNDWQLAINEIARLLDLDQGDEVILPTSERQHLAAVREDGTVYLSETGINLYKRNSPFLGLWLVDPKKVKELLGLASIPFRTDNIPIGPVSVDGPNSKNIMATTRKVDPKDAMLMAEYLSSIASTSKGSASKVSLSVHGAAVLEKADVILYSDDENFETNVGGALIVPGVGATIQKNTAALKINLAEITEKQGQDKLLNYLERGYRYLSGNTLMVDREDQFDSIEQYVNYVLGGEVSGVDTQALAASLVELERKTKNKVNAVSLNAHTFTGQDFFSSSALIDSIISLKGIQQAGFVVSNDGGLMHQANAGSERAHAPLGLFHRDPKVVAMINEIRGNWPNIVSHGAFVFDVDQTILPKGSRGLHEFNELAYLFMRLLREDVKVAIISGNSQSQVMKRMYEAIKSEMKDDHSAFKNLTLYVNVGATKIEFDSDGKDPIVDLNYSVAHGMDENLMQEAINEALKEAAAENFGLNEEAMAEFLKAMEEYRAINYPKLNFTLPWKDGGAWRPEWESEQDIEHPVDGREIAVPWIEMRGEARLGGEQVIGSLAIKPTPEFKIGKDKYDVRRMIQNKIIERLTAKGKAWGDFIFTNGGKTTTDITQVKAKKTTALLDFIASNHLDAQWVYYLGDEFFVRKGKEGNDESIARASELSRVKTLAVNMEDMEGADAKTLWIGRSPQATVELLEAVVDPAMTTKINGGIDLNAITLKRTGELIKIPVDPAQLNELTQGGFEGFSPLITKITLIKDLGLLLTAHAT